MSRARDEFGSYVVDLDFLYETETDGAYAVKTDEKAQTTWLPKSQVEWVQGTRQRGRLCTLTVPEWLAHKNNLA